MGHRLSSKQGPDDVGALAKACISLCLLRPYGARQVLIQALSAAEGQPEAPREHLAQCRGRLSQNGRVVAVAWSGDHAEGKVSGLQGSSEPGPCKAGLPLRRP